MKQLLIKWKLWKEERDQRVLITEKDYYFMMDAFKHYCKECDRFFEDIRKTRGHIRLKHQGGMKPKNA